MFPISTQHIMLIVPIDHYTSRSHEHPPLTSNRLKIAHKSTLDKHKSLYLNSRQNRPMSSFELLAIITKISSFQDQFSLDLAFDPDLGLKVVSFACLSLNFYTPVLLYSPSFISQSIAPLELAQNVRVDDFSNLRIDVVMF